MPAPAKAKEAPIEALPPMNVSNVALTNSMSSAAINLAPNSMTGSKQKKRCFKLRNGQCTNPTSDEALKLRLSATPARVNSAWRARSYATCAAFSLTRCSKIARRCWLDAGWFSMAESTLHISLLSSCSFPKAPVHHGAVGLMFRARDGFWSKEPSLR